MPFNHARHVISITNAHLGSRVPLCRVVSSLAHHAAIAPDEALPKPTVSGPDVSIETSEHHTAWPPSSSFASYNVTLEPTVAQLGYADTFFQTAKMTFLKSHAKFKELPLSSVPEVAFLGRSNVGKSSLLNALLHRTSQKIAKISRRPGMTKLMNAFAVGDVQIVGGQGKNPSRRAKRENPKSQESQLPSQPVEFEQWVGSGLVVLDMPGYGYASRDEWGHEIVKYLTGRKQLRRTYVLIDSEHALKNSDLHMLNLLAENGVPYQLVLSKIDKIVAPRTPFSSSGLNNRLLHKLPPVLRSIRAQAKPPKATVGAFTDDLLMCSAEVTVPPHSGKKIGIDNLRWAILSAVGLDSDAQGRKRIISANVVP